MWNELSSSYSKYGSYFDDVMRNVARQQPSFLPPLARSRKLMVTSDFSGAQPASRFTALSFVIAPIEDLKTWNRYRRRVREHFALANRRMAYSKLTDRRKRAALTEFIDLANSLRALSVTVLVEKRIPSLFTSGTRIDPDTTIIGDKTFQGWKPSRLERMLQAAYLIALFIAGLSSPRQHVTWITDEDEIAPNKEGLLTLTRAFGAVLASIAPHPLGVVRVGTTGTVRREDLALEDFASIPDLIGGAVNDFVVSYGDELPLTSFITLAPPSLPRKANDLIIRFFDERAPLRKLIFTVEAVPGSCSLRYGSSRIVQQPRLIVPAGG